MNQEQIEQVECLIDEAGYFIDYWAVKGHHDTQALTYKVTLDEDAADHLGKRQVTITYAEIDQAIRKLAQGGIVRPDLTQAAQVYITEPGDADLDAAFADCAVQVAIFGDVVFG